MTTQARVRPYEILVRLKADEPAAAHMQRIAETLEDGVVIAASIMPAEPLDVAVVLDVLGPEFPVLANRNAELEAQATADAATISGLQYRVEEQAQEIAQRGEAMTQAEVALRQLEAAVAARDQAIGELRSALGAASAA